MGLHNRPYMDSEGGFSSSGGGLTFGLPKPTRAVKAMLFANAIAFVVQIVSKGWVEDFFAVNGQDWWQAWRYVSFQFLHSTTSLAHIVLNMLGLYLLGTPLEQHWGTRRFTAFYLSCGAVAGLAYVVMARLVFVPELWGASYLVGASGGVYAIVLACAVLFPHFKLIFLFFPVPIRLAAVIIFGGMLFTVLSGLFRESISCEFWSEVAHLGGAVGGAFWLWGLRGFRGLTARAGIGNRRGAWQRKLQRQQEEDAEIDRILDKIHREGINSLSRREKHILQDATRRQQESERSGARL